MAIVDDLLSESPFLGSIYLFTDQLCFWNVGTGRREVISLRRRKSQNPFSSFWKVVVDAFFQLPLTNRSRATLSSGPSWPSILSYCWSENEEISEYKRNHQLFSVVFHLSTHSQVTGQTLLVWYTGTSAFATTSGKSALLRTTNA